MTWRNTPPRGSFSMKSRKVLSRAMKRDCSHKVSPGGGATPPTMTSPTSPSAWQEMTWMALAGAHGGARGTGTGRADIAPAGRRHRATPEVRGYRGTDAMPSSCSPSSQGECKAFVRAKPLRGRFASPDRSARRWLFADHISLVTKAVNGRFSHQRDMDANRRVDEAQSPRRGRSKAKERRSRLTATRRRGPRPSGTPRSTCPPAPTQATQQTPLFPLWPLRLT